MLSPGAARPPAAADVAVSITPRSQDLGDLTGLQERLPLPTSRRRQGRLSDECPAQQATPRRQRLSKEESTVSEERTLAECSPAQMMDHFRRKSKESFYGDEFDHLHLPGVAHIEQSPRSGTQHESDAPSPQPGDESTDDRWILDMPIDAEMLRRMAKQAARVTAADEQAGRRPRA